MSNENQNQNGNQDAANEQEAEQLEQLMEEALDEDQVYADSDDNASDYSEADDDDDGDQEGEPAGGSAEVMEAQTPAAGATPTPAAATTTTKPAQAAGPKAWEAFTAGLDAHARALGLEVTQQKGFVKYVNGKTGHKLYVARGGREVKRIDTTLPILGRDGTYALEKPNGKIECHVKPDVETVKAVLTDLASDTFGHLRPARRETAATPTKA